MRALQTGFDIDRFFQRLASARDSVLLADYDGTLAPFHVEPSRAMPYPGVVEALDLIMACCRTRVVIVSGRKAEEVAVLLRLREQPEIWGAHGWQRLAPDGTHFQIEPGTAVRRRMAEAEALARRYEPEGARIELKPASVAVHWRGLPPEAAAAIGQALRRDWQPLTQTEPVQILDFDGGLELRASLLDKRHAVKAVLAAESGECAAYLGDDTTDEDAFAAVQAQGGVAILVRAEPRATRADFWLQPPGELMQFLQRWSENCERTARHRFQPPPVHV